MGDLFLENIGVGILQACKKCFQCIDRLLVVKIVGVLGLNCLHEACGINMFSFGSFSGYLLSSLFRDFDLGTMAASRLYFFGRR